jgi:hypothetical protein
MSTMELIWYLYLFYPILVILDFLDTFLILGKGMYLENPKWQVIWNEVSIILRMEVVCQMDADRFIIQ